jgi:hypothetical protein
MIRSLRAHARKELQRDRLQCAGSAVSIQPRNRPAKQVRGITLVEPTFIEQGPRSYTWLGVLSASPERLMSHGWVPPS